MTMLALIAAAAAMTVYPADGDRLPLPRPHGGSRVEVATDKGPIVELIVRCPRGSAVLSYSKVERVYCTPRDGCLKDLQAASAKACR